MPIDQEQGRRKAVVVALRGTMTLADVVTDAVAVPERIDGWLPKGVMESAARGRRKHRAYAHSGMVATTQNLEADLNKKCVTLSICNNFYSAALTYFRPYGFSGVSACPL